MSIAVKNLEQTRSYLAQHDVSFQWDAANPKTLRISPQEALGVRFILIEQ